MNGATSSPAAQSLSAAVPSSPTTSTTSSTDTNSGGVPAQVSPSWLSDIQPMAGNVQSYPTGPVPTGPFTAAVGPLTGYPQAWKAPDPTSAEVVAVINSLDWTQVPNSAVRQAGSGGGVKMTGYSASDPDCWWSASGCTVSKRSNIPADVAFCPTAGDWGLTYDDGPLTADAGQWAEPNLYDSLAANNQKAGLFYIGSNVVNAPAAAQRALADGHTICVHTWSHPAMTSQTNQQIVAQFYWTLRAIKEVTGVTPRCWRPPYGDVDDRVRAIAWQMGMTTVLWDQDTNDWNMPGSGGGNLPPATVDGYFEKWINARKSGTDNQRGHIVLQHELNDATVSMAEKWLPQVQEAFRLVPWNECVQMAYPYWEENFVYPPGNPTASSSSDSAAGISSVSPSTTQDATLSVGSSGVGSGAESTTSNSKTSGAHTSVTANKCVTVIWLSLISGLFILYI
ncbi:hypothetical protein J3Q64DRAFT_1630702 [Phycomyces blakesleeanus]|uniref:NodB homology domain-containing protein n=2 Tax=Phycomyces blakesleeanus TaxID=4837 RepID=A0ABR3BFF7_PHYBL